MNRRPSVFRRRYIVDARLQYSLCRQVVGYSLLTLVGVTVGLFWPVLSGLADPTSEMDGDFATVMLYMHDRFWIIALVCLVLAAGGSILTSQRIAGPMVRFKRNLRMLADGRLPAPLRTRSRDFMKEEVDCLNSAVMGVEAMVDDAKAATTRLQQAVVELRHRAERIADTELTAVVADADRALHDLKSQLARFVVEGDIDGPLPQLGSELAMVEG